MCGRYKTSQQDGEKIKHARTVPIVNGCLEIIAVAAILIMAYHLVHERIDARLLPSGDEGSWMSVAAQLARGEGFTTRWLEHPFLDHPDLPRPDDFRYPAFTLLLAAAFKMFGISYSTGLWTVGALHLLLLLTVYAVCRNVFGVAVALITMLLTAFSLLQLYWNTCVYVEALSGCCLGLIVWRAYRCNPARLRDSALLGALMGLFYLIRPNGILLAAGLLFLRGWNLKLALRQWRPLLVAVATMVAVMLPWLVRTAYYFGNPFHVATGAGLLRADTTDPLTLTAWEFFMTHGPGQILRALAYGVPRLFTALDFFEHGLQILPLAGFAAAIITFRKQIPACIVTGFMLTLFACAYVAYNYSWAGVRYLSSFLPWMYALGIAFWMRALCRLTGRWSRFAPWVAGGALALLLIAPVVYPHRFYERHFSLPPPNRAAIIAEHIRILDSLVPENGVYCAHSLAQVNFMTARRCVGMHEFFDSSHVATAVHRFYPSILALTGDELKDVRIQGIMREFEREGLILREVKRTSIAHFYRLEQAAETAGDQLTGARRQPHCRAGTVSP